MAVDRDFVCSDVPCRDRDDGARSGTAEKAAERKRGRSGAENRHRSEWADVSRGVHHRRAELSLRLDRNAALVGMARGRRLSGGLSDVCGSAA